MPKEILKRLTDTRVLGIVGLCVLALMVFALGIFIFRASFEFSGFQITNENEVLIYFSYITDRDVEVKLLGPDNSVIDSTTVKPSNTYGVLKMGGALQTPEGGTYTLRAERFWKTLDELQISALGAYVSISDIYPEWGWDSAENKATIRSFRFELKNDGDFPAYVAKVTAYLGGDNIGTDDVNVWVKPGKTHTTQIKIWSGPLNPGVQKLVLVAEDPSGEGLPGPTMTSFPYFIHGLAFVAVPDFPILSYHAVDEWQGTEKSMFPPSGSSPIWWIVDSWFGKKVNARTIGWSIYQQISVGTGAS